MKLEVQKQDVQIEGDFVTSKFTMEINAKAFDILVNKIYSDKVGAIVRELGANAWDAQVEAKTTEVPFLIHLPNTFEPYFRIRDYGTGLSEDDINNLYTRVFKSNKTNSNELIGCMGLGSKTPFCYADSFVVVSYYNGKKYCYLAHKDDEGIPCISQMQGNGIDTIEPNGLDITINVKSEDFETFKDKVKFFYRFYPTRPKVLGQNVEFELDCLIYQDDRIKLLSDENESYIIMGNVPYCVNEICGAKGVVAKVDIGEADIEASREGLEDTVKNRNLYEKIHKQVLVIVEKIREENNASTNVNHVWRTKSSNNRFCHLNHTLFGYGERIQLYSVSPYKMYGRKSYWLNYEPIINLKDNISGDIIFVAVDKVNENRPSPLQIKWLRENFGFTVIIFCFEKHNTQSLIQALGIANSDIHFLEDIPKAKVIRAKTKSVGITGWQSLRSDRRLQYSWLDTNDFDINTDILCCRKMLRIVDENDKEYMPVDISRLLSFLKIQPRVISLNYREYIKFTKTNQPKLLFDTIKDAMAQKCKTMSKCAETSRIFTYNSLDYDSRRAYDFITNESCWFTDKLKKELNVDVFQPTDSNANRELNEVLNYAKIFQIPCKIDLNQTILEGIKKYREKYKILELVECEEEYRPDIFRLLGVD